MTLARLVEFIREPHGEIADIRLGHDALLQQTSQAHANLRRMAALPDLPGAERIQLLCRAQFGLLLSATMLVNSLLRALAPGDRELAGQVRGFPDEMVGLSREVSRYKPVGSGFVLTCLLMGCVATTDPDELVKLTDAMAEYGVDPLHARWDRWASEMRTKIQELRLQVALAHLENSMEQGWCIV